MGKNRKKINFLAKIWLNIFKMAVYQLRGHIILVFGHFDKKIFIDLEKTCQKLKNSIFG